MEGGEDRSHSSVKARIVTFEECASKLNQAARLVARGDTLIRRACKIGDVGISIMIGGGLAIIAIYFAGSPVQPLTVFVIALTTLVGSIAITLLFWAMHLLRTAKNIVDRLAQDPQCPWVH
jgi:hypothetical protein